MVSVRCQTDLQLIGVEVIPVVQPGELQSVACDWKVPMDATVLRFSAVVDRGLEISEGNESNNIMEQLVTVAEQSEDSADETGGLFSARTAFIGGAVLALVLLGLVVFTMPPKMKNTVNGTNVFRRTVHISHVG